LDLQFTFAIRGRNIEIEVSSETLGTRNFTNTAMLISLTAESHLAALRGTEDAVSVSAVMFYGVLESAKMRQSIQINMLRE
jgi:hypothetical protein